MVERFDKGQVMTLGQRGKFILVELPPMFLVQGVTKIFQRFLDRGVTPIIAHPERNSSLMKKQVHDYSPGSGGRADAAYRLQFDWGFRQAGDEACRADGCARDGSLCGV